MSDAAEGEALVFVGRPPPLVEGRVLFDAALPFVAVALFWAVRAREEGHDAVDPAALILTVLALLAATQAVFGIARIWRRIWLAIRAGRHRLVLDGDALRLELPGERFEVPRTQIWGVSERGHWGKRRGAGRRFSPVFVVVDPAVGRTHLELPPVFGEGPGMIAETLMRWRGPDPVVPPVDAPESDGERRLKSRIYDDAVAGRVDAATIAVPHGRRWLGRGPYITALLGVALVLRWLAFDAQTAWLIGPEMIYIVFFGTLMVPAAWIVLTLRELRPRKGLAFVLTPRTLLIRTRRGVLETPLQALGAPEIEQKRAWSAVFGLHVERTLVLPRADEPAIRYEEAFLGVPAEVALIQLKTRRRQVRVAPKGPEAASEDRD